MNSQIVVATPSVQHYACLFHVRGCKLHFIPVDLATHISQCEFGDVQCTGCQYIIPKQTITQHKTDTCVARVISCVKCNESYKKCDYDTHYLKCVEFQTHKKYINTLFTEFKTCIVPEMKDFIKTSLDDIKTAIITLITHTAINNKRVFKEEKETIEDSNKRYKKSPSSNNELIKNINTWIKTKGTDLAGLHIQEVAEAYKKANMYPDNIPDYCVTYALSKSKTGKDESKLHSRTIYKMLKGILVLRKDDDDDDHNVTKECELCDIRNVGRKVIICDHCEKDYHISCIMDLSPIVDPNNNWFCYECKKNNSNMGPVLSV